jgi:nitroimidazol reductase NimA-like FMN-containing flavoprotein (pyridoxamine 5'-phosphate oxidase superfamily)
MPEYGLVAEDAGEGLLPWSWAVERLERSRNFWLSTVRADGRPHAMAVWAVWLDGALYFSTAVASRKTRNLARSPRCVVTTEHADEAVIVEGVARLASREPGLSRLRALYEAKYDSGYPPDSAVFSVRPVVVFGFVERADRFAKTATRWSFAPE